MIKKKLIALGLTGAMAVSMLAGCGSAGSDSASSADAQTSDAGESTQAEESSASSDVPSIDSINLGTDYQDIKADIKILTNRTDIVDTTYAQYAESFHELYPNITVTYEAVTDYEESVTLRLTTGDWGDICFIPTSCSKADLGNYFIPLGDLSTLDSIYNFASDKAFDGKVYGIANGGNADGIAYNKKVWEEAGITEVPTTPDEFLDDLQKIKDNTDAIPLYTNFAAGWTMGAWDSYIFGSATGDPEFHNDIAHTKDPFTDRGDGTGPYAVYYVLYESVARKLVEDDPMSTDWESSKTMINNGEIATMVLGSWSVQQFKEAGNNPDDISYMPFPITVDGKRYAGAGGNYSYAINKESSTDNQIAAMLYVKWLLDESPIFTDEGCIPARKDGEMPDFLKDFEGITLVSNNAPAEGEEDLFDNVNLESECGINNDDYPDQQILEAALTGSQTLDDIMADWNAKWSAAQESLGVEVNK